mmetsp:Transcript_16017/g.16135  ORF Transcript_16017/g.16135 Transcript_16017/m.16135 type:complete len:422 (+) Transcript_16017:121-1386(+)
MSNTSPVAIAIFGAALVVATPYTLLSKQLFSMQGIGLSGNLEPFRYPLFLTISMFGVMILAFGVHILVVHYKFPFPGYTHKTIIKSSRSDVKDELLDNSKQIIPIYLYLLLGLPSAFDVMTCLLCNAGLQYVDAAIYQMLRGSGIIHSALLRQFVLGHKLKKYQWIGIFFNVMSMLIIGLLASSAVPSDTHITDTNKPYNRKLATGVILTLLGAVTQAIQFAFEEKVLHQDVHMPPLVLIGVEGVWGVVICIFLLYPLASYLPGSDHGCIENYSNTIEILSNSNSIQYVYIGFSICCFWYNILGVCVIYLLDSIWRTMLDTFRPVTVWALALSVHYGISTKFFTGWNDSSNYQLVGMMALLYGTAVYSAPGPCSIRLTGRWYSCFMDLSSEYPGDVNYKMKADTDETNVLISASVSNKHTQ